MILSGDPYRSGLCRCRFGHSFFSGILASRGSSLFWVDHDVWAGERLSLVIRSAKGIQVVLGRGSGGVTYLARSPRVRYKGKEKPTIRSALYDYCFGCPKALNPPAVHFAVLMQVRNATISLDFPAEI